MAKPKPDQEKLYINWKTIQFIVDDLYEEIRNEGIEVDRVYGIERGGLVPAVMLSHKFNVPLAKNALLTNTLIVDDIADSGDTLENIIEQYNIAATTVTLYKRYTSQFDPTFFGHFLDHDDWLVFPWEDDNE